MECGATQEDLVELIAIFKEDAENCINIGLEALATGEFSLLQEKMHALKGTAAAVGAFRLQEAAAALEKSPNSNTKSNQLEIDSLNALLEHSLTELRSIHSEYLTSEPG